MASIEILGETIDVEFRQGDGAATPPDAAAALAGAGAMADLINIKQWPARLAEAYTSLEGIVFFTGTVEVNGHPLSRPGVDERNAVFYWAEAEFRRNDADGHANTLFHDGWHVVQFRRAGNRHAVGLEERIEREIDATDRQMEAALILGSSAADLADLLDYRNDRERIIARLGEGVGEAD